MPKIKLSESKLFKILLFLSHKEQKKLKDWLTNPWFNSNSDLTLLYQCIVDDAKSSPDETLDRVQLHQKLFPETPLDKQKLNTLMSTLHEKVEDFLIYEKLAQNHPLKEELLVDIYRERGLDKESTKQLNSRISRLSQKPILDSKDATKLHELYEKRHRQSYPKAETDLYQANYFLDLSYKMGKYRLLLEFSEHKKILDNTFNLEAQINTLKNIRTDHNLHTFNFYQFFFDLDLENSVETLKFLIQKYFLYHEQFPIIDQSILLLSLINYGARFNLKGHQDILQEVMVLYKHGIEKELLVHNGKISTTAFANVVTVGNILKEFNFVEQFIRDYQNHLPLESKSDAVTWAKTHLAFNSKRFISGHAIKTLHKMESQKHKYAIRTKILSLQIWLEEYLSDKEKSFDFVVGLCQNFIKQLGRNKHYPPKRLEAIRNLIKSIKEIAKLKEKGRLKPLYLNPLRTKIIQHDNIFAQNWLLTILEKFDGE